MCQKAFGNFFAPLTSVRGTDFEWTRGEPKRFQSSNHVKRGFCGNCGTPLTYEAPDGTALAIGAFDEPEELAPTIQWGIEDKLPYVDDLIETPRIHIRQRRGIGRIPENDDILSTPRP